MTYISTSFFPKALYEIPPFPSVRILNNPYPKLNELHSLSTNHKPMDNTNPSYSPSQARNLYSPSSSPDPTRANRLVFGIVTISDFRYPVSSNQYPMSIPGSPKEVVSDFNYPSPFPRTSRFAPIVP